MGGFMSESDIEMIEQTSRAVFVQWCIDKEYLTKKEAQVSELVDFIKDKHKREYDLEVSAALKEYLAGF